MATAPNANTTFNFFNNATGSNGALQLATGNRNFTSSDSLRFDTRSSNLNVEGNVIIQSQLRVQTAELQNLLASGNLTAANVVATSLRNLGNVLMEESLRVNKSLIGNVIQGNVFYGDGSQLANIPKTRDTVLEGNVRIPIIPITAPGVAPVPIQLLRDQLALKANIDSPTFTGNPQLQTSPTLSDSDKSIATTEFVQIIASGKANTSNVTLTNVNLLGNVTAPTVASITNNTVVATTAFVQQMKNNIVLTGTPTAPIPNANAVANQIATAGFVRSTGAPCVILSRRGGSTLEWNPGVWQNIPFDTFDRNTISAAIDGTGFDLPAGTYVYQTDVRVSANGDITEIYMRLQNVDTNFTIQNISSGRTQGIGQFTLSGTTTLAIQVNGSITGVISPKFGLPAGQGYQQAYIQLFKVA